MTPKDQGRLCDKCCKVVVDFTKKTTDEIVGFLKENSGRKICGRFRSEVITKPVAVRRHIPRFRLFAAALMFVFGSFLFSSCRSTRHEPEVMGKVSVQNFGSGNIGAGDTLHSAKGNVKKGKKKCVVQPVKEREIMGDVAYVPDSLR